MMRGRHAAWCVGATLLLLIPITGRSWAQPDAASPVVESSGAALPSAGATLEAYQTVERWLRDSFRAPGEPAAIDPAGTMAACVTVRLSGQVLGRATEHSTGGDALWRAARRALLEAREAAPAQRDATRDAQIREIAQRATLDIQLAGRLTPLLGDSFADAAAQLSPGLEGVAVRASEELALVFPGTMLATNLDPAEAIRAAAGRLQLPPVDLGALREDHGVIVYRFAVQHLAQALAGREPVFLFRGGRVIAPTEVSLAELGAFAHGLAQRVQNLRFPGEAPLGLLGDYQPWTGRFSPLIAPARDQALALYALSRYSSSAAIDAANRARGARTFWTVFADFIKVDQRETNPLEDPVAAAFVTLALRGAPDRPPGMPRPPTNANDPTVAALLAVRGAFDPDKGWDEALRPGERAAIAFALADASRSRADDSRLRARADAAVRSLYRESTPGTLVAYMPWLYLGELALAEGADVPSLPALLEMRDLVWRHQLTAGDAGADNPDLVGGIVFTAARNPLPTAQLTRPLAALAHMTFDERFTPREGLPAELSRLTASLRFMRQLAVGDALLHMMQDEQVSRWGVRASPWDQTLSLDATAMALLTLVETLEGAAKAR